MLPSTRLDRFLAIIAVFDGVKLVFTTLWTGSEPFNAPLYPVLSSSEPFKRTYRCPTLCLTPPTIESEQFWPFTHTRWCPTLALTPPIHPPGPVFPHYRYA